MKARESRRRSFSLAGKTAIVTGAANGVGLAIARHFLENDANVMLADLNGDSLKSVVNGNGEKARCFAGDLCDRLSQNNLIAATLSEFEGIDILVNASRQVLLSDEDDGGTETLDSMIDRNLRQHYSLSRLAAEKFVAPEEDLDKGAETVGAIVNVTSIAARLASADLCEYSLSCAALEQLTRSLSVAYAAKRIRVNAVAFGSVMSNRLRDDLAADPSLRKRLERATPLGRIADASEVASAVHFLASDEAGFITGQVLSVDGGRLLHDRDMAF